MPTRYSEQKLVVAADIKSDLVSRAKAAIDAYSKSHPDVPHPMWDDVLSCLPMRYEQCAHNDKTVSEIVVKPTRRGQCALQRLNGCGPLRLNGCGPLCLNGIGVLCAQGGQDVVRPKWAGFCAPRMGRPLCAQSGQASAPKRLWAPAPKRGRCLILSANAVWAMRS